MVPKYEHMDDINHASFDRDIVGKFLSGTTSNIYLGKVFGILGVMCYNL